MPTLVQTERTSAAAGLFITKRKTRQKCIFLYFCQEQKGICARIFFCPIVLFTSNKNN
jgi:hypothetical protein